MCWKCDQPGGSRLDYLDELRGTITECGWAVQSIERDRLHPPRAYTVGLTPRGRPELVVTGLPPGKAGALLNSVAAHVLHADAPTAGEQIPLRGGPLIEIVEVTEPSAHLFTAIELYGGGVRAVQLVYADDRGHWPWDRGFRGGKGGQPVLGHRHAAADRSARSG
ncbi:DUF4262 domain-containing protein [Amycolatopsis sp. CA-230715]|uniref:DUF4262 domain-containing protein n=1 Tax=Amycolatopsis sp. CA-230715 TaxID=2745196 RepID=UPI001C00DCE2|nr:DUF4262 domain-containing protein [Amycolatopsis sp. CA-230715]QWF77211.1 hypothetical protein HUW46_00594 [Amycolatopsis sp. CA-230715]